MRNHSKKIGIAILMALSLIATRPALAEDGADHQCRVILRHASYTSGGWAGFVFNVDVSKDWLASHRGAKVRVRYNLNNDGWKDLETTVSETPVSDDFIRFGASFSHNGYHSMGLYAVAYVEYQGKRLFDHNFESGDVGYLYLNRNNNWQAGNSNCQ